jgi:hypothetical protein
MYSFARRSSRRSLEREQDLSFIPTERQLTLFRVVEDIHDLTAAIIVLVVDAEGTLLAISGDENEIPPALRAVLSGKQLAEAGSVRELLTDVEMGTINVSVFAIDGVHVLAILFNADADLATVQSVGGEARDMLKEIFSAPLDA